MFELFVNKKKKTVFSNLKKPLSRSLKLGLFFNVLGVFGIALIHCINNC